jgi:hypothetical protein
MACLHRAWKIISFVQLNQFMMWMGYSFFLGFLYVMVAGLVLDICLVLYVGYSVRRL